MATTNVNVQARSNYGQAILSRAVDVDLAENAAGRVLVDCTGGSATVKVEVTDLGDVRDKFADASLVLWPDHTRPALRGKVTPVGGKAPVDGGLNVDGRPLLRELYDAAITLSRRVDAVREEIWAEEKAKVESAATAAAPAGSVVVRFLRSEADGWIEVWSDPEGRTLRSPKVAGRKGRIGWMSPEDHAAAAVAHDAEKAEEASRVEEDAEAEERRRAALLTATVPADAIDAYRRYEGDEEAAWAAGDEAAWALIREHADAIEAQGLARPGAAVVRRMLRGDDLSPVEG